MKRLRFFYSLCSKNQRGQSLVQVMMVAVVGSIVALEITSLISSMGQSANGIKYRSDSDTLSEEMRALLSSPVACSNSFGGLVVDASSSIAIANLFDGSPSPGVAKYTTGNIYGDRSVTLQSMTLANYVAGGAPNTAQMTLTNVLASTKNSSGPGSVSRTVNISIQFDAGNAITSCIASAKMSDGIWQRTAANQNNIFFNPPPVAPIGGKVGIGTSSPQAAFDVLGGLNVVTGASTAPVPNATITTHNATPVVKTYGVYASVDSSHALAAGVYGISTWGTTGAGVWGKGYHGIHGETICGGGFCSGVFGDAGNGSPASGVYGTTVSPGPSTGVYAENLGPANVGAGIKIKNFSATGWSIYSLGTSPSYITGSVGIGTGTPLYPLHVVGTSKSDRILLEDGAIMTPSISFVNDLLLGFYRSGAGTMSIRTTGRVWDMNGDFFRSPLGNGPALNSSGNTAATPGFTFSSNSNTGIWTPALNTIGFSAAGVEAMRIDSTGNLGIGTAAPGNKLEVNGGITVASCIGCSVIAEMMPIDGPIDEGEAVCIGQQDGKITKCHADSTLLAVGITTAHAEQILRLGCADSAATRNHLDIGGSDNNFWIKNRACAGWYPVALSGVNEFVKSECYRKDGSRIHYGDRMVTSLKNPGFLRPLIPVEQGGDAVMGKAVTVCEGGQKTGVIHVRIK